MRKVIDSAYTLQILISFVVSKRATAQQSLSKRAASPVLAVQRKAAKKPSTIASRGRGGSTIAARPRQVQELHDNSDSDLPRDVLSEHHRRNGVPRAPDPGHLGSQAGSRSGPSATDADTNRAIGAKSRNTNNGDPTTLKYYSPVWKAVLNRARFLSRLDTVTDNAFPERQPNCRRTACHLMNRSLEIICTTWAISYVSFCWWTSTHV